MTNYSELMLEMCKSERWDLLLQKAEEKNLNKNLIQALISTEKRQQLLNRISENRYSVFPPKIAQIPKGKGKFRTVYVNSDLDRIVLSLINDCLCDLFSSMIHPACKSYQKGSSTQQVVRNVSKRITEIKTETGIIGYKTDFSKYFDTVSIDAIERIWDEIEKRLGFEKDTEPVINTLRRYYRQDLYFDQQETLCKKYQSLKQGCAVASFLANVILYELDEYMSQKYEIYCRYSDDCLVIDPNTENFIGEMNSICRNYGVCLNPKKVKPLKNDEWFKFLGFLIRGKQITLSPDRVKKFQHEIEKRSIRKKNYTSQKARNAIYRYMYEGEYCWAKSCLGTVNVKKDLETMNLFILDCIRAVQTSKKRIGGLGSVLDRKDCTIIRGKGRHVTSNRLKTEKAIERYLSVLCLSNDLKLSAKLFDTVIHSL